MFTDFKASFPQVTIFSLSQIPVHEIDQKSKKEKFLKDKIVKFVDQMLDLHERLNRANTDSEKIMLKRQIGSTDQQIDEIVYNLYGLTKKEIEIIEKSL